MRISFSYGKQSLMSGRCFYTAFFLFTYSEYATAFIDKIKDSIALDLRVKTAYLYLNNTAALAAIHNAGYLRDQSTKAHAIME
jgi:hypothetical protein